MGWFHMLENRWISQQVNQPDFQMHCSVCKVHWSQGQKEISNRSTTLVAVPVATALSCGPVTRFHQLDHLQPAPLPSVDCHRGTSAPLGLLNTIAVFQGSQQQQHFKMRKRVSSQTQK